MNRKVEKERRDEKEGKRDRTVKKEADEEKIEKE